MSSVIFNLSSFFSYFYNIPPFTGPVYTNYLSINDFDFYKDKAEGISRDKALYKHKATDKVWMISNQWHEHAFASYIASDLYKLILGNNRAPTIELIYHNDGTLSIGSEFVDNFTSLKSISGEAKIDVNKFFECFPYKCNTLEAHPLYNSEVSGIEEAIAAMMIVGDIDGHFGNLGLVKINDSSNKYLVAKVDHDYSLRNLNAKNTLTNLANTLHKGTEDYKPNLLNLSKAFEQIADIDNEQFAKAIHNKINTLIQNKLIVESTNLIKIGDYVLPNPIPILIERKAKAKDFATNLKLLHALLNEDVELLDSLLKNEIDINKAYSTAFPSALEYDGKIIELTASLNKTFISQILLNKYEFSQPDLAKALIASIYAENNQDFNLLLSRIDDLNNLPDLLKEALIVSIRRKEIEMLKSLLDTVKDLNTYTELLEIAGKNYNYEVCDLLEDYGLKYHDHPEFLPSVLHNKHVFKKYVAYGLNKEQTLQCLKSSVMLLDELLELVIKHGLEKEAVEIATHSYYIPKTISKLIPLVNDDELLYKLAKEQGNEDDILKIICEKITNKQYLEKLLLDSITKEYEYLSLDPEKRGEILEGLLKFGNFTKDQLTKALHLAKENIIYNKREIIPIENKIKLIDIYDHPKLQNLIIKDENLETVNANFQDISIAECFDIAKILSKEIPPNFSKDITGYLNGFNYRNSIEGIALDEKATCEINLPAFINLTLEGELESKEVSINFMSDGFFLYSRPEVEIHIL